MADNRPDFEQVITGKVGLFGHIIGDKAQIVYSNLLSGDIHVKGKGIFFNFPWKVKAVQISLDDYRIDTKPRAIQTKDPNGSGFGPEVFVDADYTVRIADSEKFMNAVYGNNNQNISASYVRSMIGIKLDEMVAIYIKNLTYEEAVRQTSPNLMMLLNQIENNGLSIKQNLFNLYGVEVADMTVLINEDEKLKNARKDTKEAEEKKKTSAIENATRLERAQTDSAIEKIKGETAAQVEGAKFAARKDALTDEQLSAEQTTDIIKAESLANGQGTTRVFYSTGDAGVSQTVMGADVFGQVVGDALKETLSQFQQQSQPAQQQTQQQQTQSTQANVDWSKLPDTEYLSAEDSARLAAERGEQLLPGGRYHISLLNDAEKQRYHVAAQNNNQNGKTR